LSCICRWITADWESLESVESLREREQEKA